MPQHGVDEGAPDRGAAGGGDAPRIDPSFLALPLGEMAAAALERARSWGRSTPTSGRSGFREQVIRLRDAQLDGVNDSAQAGISIRVVHEGTWGFAAGVVQTPEAAARLAEQAVRVAQVSRPVNFEPVVLAPEPSYGSREWVSAYEIDPFDVPDAEKIALLTRRSRQLMDADGVDHVDTYLQAVKENKFYTDTDGTITTQQRVRVHAVFEAVTVDADGVHGTPGAFESMRTLAPPAGRGWEY